VQRVRGTIAFYHSRSRALN